MSAKRLFANDGLWSMAVDVFDKYHAQEVYQSGAKWIPYGDGMLTFIPVPNSEYMEMFNVSGDLIAVIL